MRLVPLALAVLLLPAAQAQTALTPGHPDLATPAPQSFEYVVRVAGDGGRISGWRTLAETVDGDRLLIVTRAGQARQSDRPADTTAVAWPGLAPLSRASYGGDETIRVAVAGGRLRGRAVLGNLDEAVDAPLPPDVFVEGTESRLARSLPFRAGYAATARVADGRGQVDVDTLRVVGETTFEGTDGSRVPAWTVTLARAGRPTFTYTVDAATRALLRSAYDFRPGMAMETVAPPPPPTGAVLRPGDAALSTAWMADETAAFVLNLVEPMAMEVGTATSTRTVAGGVVTGTQTISVPSQNMTMTQTTRAAVGTLAPVSQSMTGPAAAELAFTATAVTGTKGTEPVAVALDAPVFDSSWTPEIAQSLPLAAGYTATAAVYDATNGLSTVTFTVTGQADVMGAPAWAVETVSPNGPVTYYIDAATRRLVRMRMSPQPGVVLQMDRQP